jgi:hypothetical protein
MFSPKVGSTGCGKRHTMGHSGPWCLAYAFWHFFYYTGKHQSPCHATPVRSQLSPNIALSRCAQCPCNGPTLHHRCCSAPREERREKAPGHQRNKVLASTERRGEGVGWRWPSPRCLVWLGRRRGPAGRDGGAEAAAVLQAAEGRGEWWRPA